MDFTTHTFFGLDKKLIVLFINNLKSTITIPLKGIDYASLDCIYIPPNIKRINNLLEELDGKINSIWGAYLERGLITKEYMDANKMGVFGVEFAYEDEKEYALINFLKSPYFFVDKNLPELLTIANNFYLEVSSLLNMMMMDSKKYTKKIKIRENVILFPNVTKAQNALHEYCQIYEIKL